MQILVIMIRMNYFFRVIIMQPRVHDESERYVLPCSYVDGGGGGGGGGILGILYLP